MTAIQTETGVPEEYSLEPVLPQATLNSPLFLIRNGDLSGVAYREGVTGEVKIGDVDEGVAESLNGGKL